MLIHTHTPTAAGRHAPRTHSPGRQWGGGGGLAWRNTIPLPCSLESKAGVFSKKDQWPHHMTEEEPSISTVCRGARGIFEKGDLKGRLREADWCVTQGSQPSLSRGLPFPFSGFHWLKPCSQGHPWVFYNIWVFVSSVLGPSPGSCWSPPAIIVTVVWCACCFLRVVLEVKDLRTKGNLGAQKCACWELLVASFLRSFLRQNMFAFFFFFFNHSFFL